MYVALKYICSDFQGDWVISFPVFLENFVAIGKKGKFCERFLVSRTMVRKLVLFTDRHWQVIHFSVVALCFWLLAWSKWIVYFGSFTIKCIDARSNSEAQRFAGQISDCSEYWTAEAFVIKLSKILDCKEVRQNLRAVVVDEAHLIGEWQVFLNLSWFISIC